MAGQCVFFDDLLYVFFLFIRYIDDVFMTTNLSGDEIKVKLDTADQKDANIRITYKIQSCIDFLDVIVTNEAGRLITSVFHKPAAEPYILPYTSDHPRHVHRNIPYAALLRVTRICSHVNDFNMERIRIEMSLLLNDYPPAFIAKHTLRFFEQYHAVPVLKQLDAHLYSQLHDTLLHRPTRREQQQHSSSTEIGQMPEILRKKKVWDSSILYASYQFESGPRLAIPRRFREWWETYFMQQGSKVAHVKLRFASKSNRTLEHFLVHKKPSREVLTRMEETSTTAANRATTRGD